ncbi:N-acetylmuramoyl-L-alanine amidase [Bacillaceae bacterium S4-13-58]
MKKIFRKISVLFSFFILILGWGSFILADEVVIQVDVLNVRSGPGLNFETIQQVNHSEQFKVLSSEGEWVEIELKNGNTGWVLKELVAVKTMNQSARYLSPTADGLRVRSEPSTNAPVIGSLNTGSTYEFISQRGDWYEIIYNSTKGWVHGDYIKVEDQSSSAIPNTTKESPERSEEKNGVLTILGPEVSIREEASLTSNVISSIKVGEEYEILKKDKSWYQIKLENGQLGWISSWLVDAQEPGDLPTEIYLIYNETNLRAGPSTDFNIVAQGQRGQKLKVIQQQDQWFEVEWESESAFVPGWLVSRESVKKTDIPSTENILDNKTIVLDPGHGGRDTGAIGIDGAYEKDIAFTTAQAIKKKLEAAGAKVIMSRSTDVYLSLSARATLSNLSDADAFISIHYNSFPEYPSVSGIGSYYFHTSHKDLAYMIQEGIIQHTNRRDREARFEDFYVIRENSKPSVLVELGFMSNEKEEETIQTGRFQEQTALGVVQGLQKYFTK